MSKILKDTDTVNLIKTGCNKTIDLVQPEINTLNKDISDLDDNITLYTSETGYKAYFDIRRTGKLYQVKVPKYSYNTSPTCIKTLDNTGSYRLIICCNATATANLPVFIQVNGVNIPVLCKAGNTVYSSQLKKRTNYGIMYGNQNTEYVNGQFVIQDRICPKASTIPATTQTTNEIGL